MRVVIAAAGTAGHINPGIAIANKIKREEKGSKIIFIGTTRGLENDLVPRAGYELKTINAYGLSKKISIENIKKMCKTIKGYGEAKKELKGIEITEADNINIELNDYNYYYKLTEDNLKDMGLSNIKLSDTDELYIVKYDIQNAKVEIYNTKGYEGKYSLTDIEQIEK